MKYDATRLEIKTDTLKIHITYTIRVVNIFQGHPKKKLIST